MAVLRVASLNTNGMKHPPKRAKLFQHFNDSIYDVILLQETHVDLTEAPLWTQEWNQLAFWNPGPSTHSCGVGILIKNTKDIKFLSRMQDTGGRILTVTIEYESTKFHFISIYAPDRPAQRPFFFQQLPQYLSSSVINIMGGDFNVVADVFLDRFGETSSANHTQGMTQLQSVLDSFNLLDLWRKNNPYTREYTWVSRHRNQPAVRSRLDKFYLPTSLQSNYIKFDFYSIVWSDHKYITLEIPIPSTVPRGPNYWKLNTSVLDDLAYRQEIYDLLTYTKTQIPFSTNLIQWFEDTKLHIKLISKRYCTEKRRRLSTQITALTTQINQTMETTTYNPFQIEALYTQLHTLQHTLSYGTIIRCRERLILNGEKPTRFFFQKEQSMQRKKHITSLYDTSNVLQTETQPILQTLRSFYQTLYTKKPTSIVKQTELLSQLTATVPPALALALDCPITEGELYTTITQMATNKSPGIDGIPIEFYTAFWPLLKDDIVKLANLIYLNQLSPNYTQRTAVITLIHKADERELLKNWRPISLLCADYKLISKTLTNRLHPILEHVIHSDQNCSVRGRSIFSNIYLIRDIITHTQRNNQTAYLISLDFQKAFDTIDHQYMLNTLAAFKFGPIFINYIKNIYTRVTSTVINNGYMTPDISIDRGIRQGCPLSLPLYCIVAETIANAIRRNPRIRGIHVPGLTRPVVLSQYADDTTTFTTTPTSIDALYTAFDHYDQATGCKLNPDKIKGLIIGKNQTPPSTVHDVTWVNAEGMKVLGIVFFDDFLTLQNFNWNKVLRKLKTGLDKLRCRGLSLKGKVTILNTTALSKIWFLSSVIHIPAWALKTLQSYIFAFLWDHKAVHPIKRDTIYLPVARGGLGLLHPTLQNEALRLKVFLQITDPQQLAPWLYYGRYWMASTLPKFNDHWHFLRSNRVPKYNGTDPPLYYKQCRNLIATHIIALKALTSLTTHNIYHLFHTAKYRTYIIASEARWNDAFHLAIPWTKLWGHNYNSYNVGKTPDVLFKILHNCLPTGVRLKQNMAGRQTINALCHTCKTADEDTLHIFARCRIATALWSKYQSLFHSLQPNIPFVYEDTVLTLNTLPVHVTPPLRTLLHTITNFILYELWTLRNKMRFDYIQPNVERSVRIINTNITQLVTTYYQHHLRENTIAKFHQLFTLQNALCYIEGTQLIFNLPT